VFDWNPLKKLLEGAFAQINPFDNGADFSSVTNKKQQPVKTPAPQQQQRQIPQTRFAVPEAKQAFRPKFDNNQLRDINSSLDAGNSYEDIASRTKLNLDSIRQYADSSRPGYGVTPQMKQEQAQKIQNPLEYFTSQKQGSLQDSIGDFGKGVGNTTREIVQGAARAPETLVRSVADFGAKAIDPRANTSQVEDNTGLRGFLYGDAPVKTYQDQAQEIVSQAKQSDNQFIKDNAALGVFAAPALAALDVAGAGGDAAALRSGVKQVGRAVRGTADQVRTIAAKEAARGQQVINAPVQQLETGLQVDPARVAEYKQQIQQRGTIEPLIATPNGQGGYTLADGANRAAALREMGVQSAPVRIVAPERLQAVTQGGYLGNGNASPLDVVAGAGADARRQAEQSSATTIRPIDKLKDFLSNNFTDDTAYFQSLDRKTVGRNITGSVKSLPADQRLDPQIQAFRNANSVVEQRVKDFGVEDFAKSFPDQKSYDAYQIYRVNRAGVSRATREKKPNESISDAYTRFTGGRNLMEDERTLAPVKRTPFFDEQFAKERDIYNKVLRERGNNPNFKMSADDAEAIIKNDPDYAALNRVLPEDKVTMQRQGAIGSMQGKNVKELAEGSESLPVEDAVTSLREYVGDFVKKDLGNNVMNTLLKNAPGKLKPIVTSAQLKAKRAAKVTLEDLGTEGKNITRQLSKDKRQLSLVKSELEALDKVSKGKTTVYATPRQITARLSELTEDQANRIAENIKRKSSEATTLTDDIKALSTRADIVKSERAGIMSSGDLKTFKAKAGENYRRRVVDGEEEIYQVTDARLAKNLNNLSDNQVSKAARVLGVPTRVFRFFTTGTGNIVGFAPIALTRDVLSAVLFSKAPLRAALDPRSYTRAFAAAFKKGDFFEQLQRQGIGGTMVESERKAKLTSSDLMRKKGLSKAAYYAKNPKEIASNIENLDAATERFTRARFASARYEQQLSRYKRQGLSKEEAKQRALFDAAEEYREAALNFGRSGKVTKELGSVVAYLNPAVQAGNKVRRSFLESPLGTTFRLATVGAGIAGAWAWNNSDAKRKEVFDNIDPREKEGNIIIVGPDASFDKKTGKVTGITKIPLPQEYKPLTGAVEQMYKDVDDRDFGKIGLNALTTLQGIDVTSVNATVSQLFPTAAKPIVENMTNYSFFTGDKLTPDYISKTANGDKTKEVKNNTTGTALAISRASNGAVSPIQVDNLLSGFIGGSSKDVASISDTLLKKAGVISEDEATSSNALDRLRKRYTESYGKSDAIKFFDTLDEIKKSIPDQKDRSYFETLHEKTANPGILDSATKYQIYLARPDVVKAEKKLDEFNRKQGKTGNPLFDLNDDQMNKVLAYRASKMLNAGKQTYDKNGNPLFTSLGLDEKWYTDLRSKETSFYASVKKAGTTVGDDTAKTFSGESQPKASPALQSKLDAYYKLKSGTGDRSRFLRANPDVLKYWESSDGFTNKERAAIGLKPTEKEEFKSSGSTGTKFARRRSGGSKVRGGGSSGSSPTTIKNNKLKDLLKGAKVTYKKPGVNSPAPAQQAYRKIKKTKLTTKKLGAKS
jgi:conjugative element/phage-associated large polyvalent protein/ParB-like nuclease family protein